ncbi:MAG: sulfurtransferase [Okeania sp. SIO2G4]|uniref:sulfurtransferase n=1 Tax=unclassified Okeania TaxID=2634635 RepID=UPI0013BE0B3C|nr:MULTISPECIES: sulfurtransferase [unclassified Okeania]NEP04778.1 sulfurtransferase [Okeania sp. SIO4D6]NEP44577.1 sulfurtransferase [Okeania sp. SIO2H7]NEP70941.1 sulfurtransferase [Okeania sp. SIO2G5]NEP92279.1 sulfurtransferase [Okeania sp. SIO2F5]NEQ89993.1 sulfurtransferase [Okeania sp. SIO2G4]
MTNKNILISPQWLVDHLNDPDLIIIDCRFSLADPELGQKQYQAGHIPGAFYLDLNQDLSSAVQKHGGRHPLPVPDKLSQKLASIGVKYRETLIVAYDDSRFAFASRLWWLLTYMGHEKVALLDGGFSEWQKKYPITNEISTPKAGFFEPQIQSKMVVDIETVKAKKDLPEVVLVDSRDSDRYLGKHEPIDPIAGHIPGAVNYPWKQVTDENSQAKVSEQVSRWEEVKSAEEVMVYCGSGVTACVNLWSLKMAGINTGKLYAGSWSDWCSYLVDNK